MKKHILLAVFIFLFTKVQAKDSSFITKWNLSENLKVQLKISDGYALKDYDMTIDWVMVQKSTTNLCMIMLRVVHIPSR